MERRKRTKDKPVIRTRSFKVVGIENDWTETRRRWRHLACVVQRLTNRIWTAWLFWHQQHDSGPKIWRYMDDLRAWHAADKKERGKKPQCEVKCSSSEISKAIYAEITKAFPELNLRPVVLAMNLVQKRMANTPASKGSYPRWMRILADEGEFPSSSKPLPIPFDVRNAKLIPPDDDKSNWKIELRIDRIERPGEKTAASTLDVITIQTRGRKCMSQTADLWKILAGKIKFCGSALTYKAATGTWEVKISIRYPKPESTNLDESKTAVMRAGRLRPWFLRISGRSRWLGGATGRYVTHVRRQLITQRWSRQGAYRIASSSKKGHGRKRATGDLEHLKRRWRDFVKTMNHQVSRDAVERCVRQGYGRLVYLQPGGDRQQSRFLYYAGKVPSRRDNTGWDWAQLATLLAYKCQEMGVEFVVKKPGERGDGGGDGSGFPKRNRP